MKYLVLIVFIVFFQENSRSQNLITNGSFEDIDSCYGAPAPIGFDVFEWSACKGWSNPLASSSDLWCPHQIGGVEPPNIAGVGFQQPRTGNNMAGLVMNGGNIISYREYLQFELSESLNSNTHYKLTFYHSPLYVDCSINQFGVFASSTKLNNQTVYSLSELVPNGISEEKLYSGDTSIWNLVEINFKAVGGEKFLIFGNFQDSTNASFALPCDTSGWNGISYAGNYFFIDDVQLEAIQRSLIIPNVFTPNGDGINDLFSIDAVNYPGWELTIMNRWGQVIFTLNNDLNSFNGGSLSDGVYFYLFECEALEYKKQGYISIVR